MREVAPSLLEAQRRSCISRAMPPRQSESIFHQGRTTDDKQTRLWRRIPWTFPVDSQSDGDTAKGRSQDFGRKADFPGEIRGEPVTSRKIAPLFRFLFTAWIGCKILAGVNSAAQLLAWPPSRLSRHPARPPRRRLAWASIESGRPPLTYAWPVVDSFHCRRVR